MTSFLDENSCDFRLSNKMHNKFSRGVKIAPKRRDVIYEWSLTRQTQNHAETLCRDDT